MEKYSIGVYARMKPSTSAPSDYKISRSESSDIITFKRLVGGKKPTSYSFKFNKIFEVFTKQNEIFNLVAKPVVDRVLQGYNGTIMAYGQTGSGKTYTISGGTKTYDDRGIVPRTLQYLYGSFQGAEAVYNVHVSYLEIYNECGYDLLTRKTKIAHLEDFPRITVMEDTNHKYHIKNLRLQPAVTEAEALEILFLGDTNRVIAETPVNPCSSRSHCIFTIHLTTRKPGSTKVRRSKLNMVDLAGSERASKVGLNGVTLREAKSINRSLHFLERVTAALADSSSNSSSSHVPYRNSLLTTILRDSLGGNCLTTFVITLATDVSFLPETLSSCRFSQRAAMIKNVAVPNEEPDLMQEAALLRDEVARLKEMLANLANADTANIMPQKENSKLENEGKELKYSNEELPEDIILMCKSKVENFISQDDKDEIDSTKNELDVGNDPRCVQLCFKLLKKCLQDERIKNEHEKNSKDKTEILKYKEKMQKKEDQISILINLLKEENIQSNKISLEYQTAKCGNCNYMQQSTKQKTFPWSNKYLDCKLSTEKEEEIAFKELTEIESAGASLKNEITEINVQLENKYEEAIETTQMLQTKRETIIHLCQQLNDFKGSDGYWHTQFSNKKNADYGQLDINDKSKTLASSISSKEVLENSLKREQEIYNFLFTKLQGLKDEMSHLSNTLNQKEIKLKLYFKWHWDEIQKSKDRVKICETNSLPEKCHFNPDYARNPKNTFLWSHTINEEIPTYEKTQDCNPNSTILNKNKDYSLGIPYTTCPTKAMKQTQEHTTLDPAKTLHELNQAQLTQRLNLPYCITPSHLYMHAIHSPISVHKSNLTECFEVPERAFCTSSNVFRQEPKQDDACNSFPSNKSNTKTLTPINYGEITKERCIKLDVNGTLNNLDGNAMLGEHAYHKRETSKPYTAETDHLFINNTGTIKSSEKLLRTNITSGISLYTSNPTNQTLPVTESQVDPIFDSCKINAHFYKTHEKQSHQVDQLAEGNERIQSVESQVNRVNYIQENLTLTGDEEVDKEILAFYKARSTILEKKRMPAVSIHEFNNLV